MRIVFMGTPDFAATSLQRLHEAGLNIVGVITATDKPAGRGQKLQASAVKQYAAQAGLHILQPPNLKDPGFLADLAALKADLFVVVAFRMLPEVVWAMPPLGTINLHGSLLPQYRGAAPIHWAVINGETETGVTTFFIEKEIDTGQMIAHRSTPIGPDETTGEVYHRLMHLGADLLLETVQAIAEGRAQRVPQPQGANLKHAPKLQPADGHTDWNRPALQVHNHIRGLSPYPGAYAQREGKVLKLLRCHVPAPQPTLTLAAPGTLTVYQKMLLAACADGWLQLLELKPEGKPAMPADAYIQGYRPDGALLQ